MGDKMTCMPFSQIMDWVLEEKKANKTVFGTHKKYVAGEEKTEIFGRNLENSHRSGSRTPIHSLLRISLRRIIQEAVFLS